MAPLSGVKVLDVTRLLPGGFCSMVLADLGADVIKVEEPGRGDYMRMTPPTLNGVSLVHTMVNKRKESIGLNLKDEEGKEILRRLISRSDVFLEGFRPGVIARLGFPFEVVRRLNPRIVYCSISAFGQASSLSSMPGHDLNFQAMSGALGSVEEPRLPFVQYGDVIAGMYAAIGILAALTRHSKKERAVFVDVPIVQSLMSLNVLAASSYFSTGEPPRLGQSLVFGSDAYYNLFKASDGRWLAVAAIEGEFWRNLLREMDLADLEDVRFGTPDERKSLKRRMEDVFKTKTRDEWAERLMERNTCATPVLDINEALDADWASSSGIVSGPKGDKGSPTRLLNLPLNFNPGYRKSNKKAPRLGEDTENVLRRLGFGSRKIGELRKRGAIA